MSDKQQFCNKREFISKLTNRFNSDIDRLEYLIDTHDVIECKPLIYDLLFFMYASYLDFPITFFTIKDPLYFEFFKREKRLTIEEFRQTVVLMFYPYNFTFDWCEKDKIEIEEKIKRISNVVDIDGRYIIKSKYKQPIDFDKIYSEVFVPNLKEQFGLYVTRGILYFYDNNQKK